MDSLGILQRLGGGHLIDEIAAALVQTAEEVAETKRNGSVTISLKVTKSIGDDIAVIVTESIKRSSPLRGERGAMFMVHEGALHREDPRQIRMELRTVGGQTELRATEDPGRDMREIG
jgi:hypothetical protein